MQGTRNKLTAEEILAAKLEKLYIDLAREEAVVPTGSYPHGLEAANEKKHEKVENLKKEIRELEKKILPNNNISRSNPAAQTMARYTSSPSAGSITPQPWAATITGSQFEPTPGTHALSGMFSYQTTLHQAADTPKVKPDLRTDLTELLQCLFDRTPTQAAMTVNKIMNANYSIPQEIMGTLEKWSIDKDETINQLLDHIAALDNKTTISNTL